MTDAAQLVLEMVYRYRQLAGQCEVGLGLDMGEVMEVTAIESKFAGTVTGDQWSDQRQFARAEVDLAGDLATRRFHDPVHITDLGPGGMVISDAPYLERGETVAIAVSQESGCFRFVAEVAWIRDDRNGSRTGLKLCGIPLLLRQPQRHAAATPAPSATAHTIPAAA